MRRSVCPPLRMRYSFESRCRIVRLILAGESPSAAAAACGASRATGYRLWRRFQEGGWAALADRPSVPMRQPRRRSRELEQRILAAREYAKAGPLIVAGQLGLPPSTVWKVLRRHGVSRLRLPAREPVRRYERSRPGELVHVDIKKLGRFWTIGKRVYGDGLHRNRRAGWQYLHLAIDDHSRLAYARSCSQAKAPPTVSPSSAAPSPGTASAGSPSSVCSPTTATATAPSPGATPAPSSASAAATHAREDRRPTARPKPSSRRCCANGRTASPTPQARTAPERSPATYAGTTTTDRTARSAAGHQSAASHRSVGPTARCPAYGRCERG